MFVNVLSNTPSAIDINKYITAILNEALLISFTLIVGLLSVTAFTKLL